MTALLAVALLATSWPTPFETQGPNYSATYDDAVRWYETMDSAFANLQFTEAGASDAGWPIHLAIVSKDGLFDPQIARLAGRSVCMINNAIHPGESCGVDASMLFVRQLLTDPEVAKALDSVVFCIVPIYNVGGALNRSCCSRANQTGPHMQGFRGNAQNLDLNRDFVKGDALNTWTFWKMFQQWDPDVFVDAHTTNGADYPYTMTLITTEPTKLGAPLGHYLKTHFEPQLYEAMLDKGDPMCPYVFTRDGTPESGLVQFPDHPRYSMGYASLFQTLAFTSEAHMLKPYADRVYSTLNFYHCIAQLTARENSRIQQHRLLARRNLRKSQTAVIRWALDSLAQDSFHFTGYRHRPKPSEVSGLPVRKYHQDSLYHEVLPWYRSYQPDRIVPIPEAYIIPFAWREVIQRLRANGVEMTEIDLMQPRRLEVYYIDEFDVSKRPYEGHVTISVNAIRTDTQMIGSIPRAYRIPTDQLSRTFIVQTLEPQAPDAFMVWNFFDAILQQKEYFSGYVFDSTAARLLHSQPDIRAAFDKAMQTNAEFAGNLRAQHDFIYRRSEHYEAEHLRYPVFREITEE